MNSVINGLILWTKAVLPALFPFFFLSKMLTELGSIKFLALYFEKFTQRVFKVSGISSYAFFMSIFSGYPVGAKITSELYENKMISYNDMHKLCAFCSTSGPLFLIGTIGVGMLHSKQAGLIIFVCHIIGALLNGILWRNYKVKHSYEIKTNIKKANEINEDLLSYTITNSVASVLIVGGFIALFCMFVDVGINTGILGVFAKIISLPLQFFNIDADYSLAFVTGLIEITRGSLEVSKIALSQNAMIILITILISFGGLSTHLQSLAFLGKHKLKISFLLKVKFTQCVISGIIAYLFLLIFY